MAAQELFPRASDTDYDPDAGCSGCASGGPTSLSGLISTLVPTVVLAGVYFGFFLILRKSQRRFYAPRTYLGSLRESERTPELPNGLFNWFGSFWKIPDTYALKHQSLDAYLFLRFLRIACSICLGGIFITWPILLPINATGGGNQEQLERVSWSNIDIEDSTQKKKLWAHVVVAWVYYGFVLYMILRELIFYINIRQAVLLSPMHSYRMSNRTVLFISVPELYLDEIRLRSIFGDGVKRIWIAGDSKDLDDIVEERNKVAMKLEKAEVKLMKMAIKERSKAISKGATDDKGTVSPDAEPGSLAARWIPDKKRPTHKLGLLGLIGKKVDTINWCREELLRLIPEAGAAQDKYRNGDYKKTAAVFIEFYEQSQAQAAYQVLAHHHALRMSPRYIGIKPSEVVWPALSISWWQRVVRGYAVRAFIAALIIFWAIPVAFVGVISNISALQDRFSWLSWLDQVPDEIMGVITGLLPSVLLAVLMALVPIIMRLCAKLAGEPSLSRVELFTQNAYFCFQVIQVFLVTTFSSGATAVVSQIIDSPTDAPALLAQNLPKASNFYIAYFLVQGFTIGVGVLAQVAGFAIFKILYKYLATTPRAMYTKWATLSAIGWGNTMPVYSLITVICITYAGIAPLVSGFALLGIALFYLAYRYNILFVTDTQIDTHGLIYPRAIKQLLVGVYLAELCMIGLFGASKAFGQLVLMVIFLVITVLYTITIFKALNPLLYNLPQSLQVAEESMKTGPGDLEVVAPGDGKTSNPNQRIKNAGKEGDDAHTNKATTAAPETDVAASGKNPNILMKWLKPWKYADYATLRKLVPRDGPKDINALYPEEFARDAYFPPSVRDKTPLLWIPEDPAGISKQEIHDINKVIPITDEQCTMDDKGKLHWDAEGARPPVWEEKIQY
ncbi:uncharacterized protein MKZ38_001147 [Zalerion maritima]|uniref:Uncharacterized protein n=1 Tax=Zalerion maritima TaxID=339359 RepID=A0AAD5RQI2_9PEZI|nr:uncharacterized protein MKZ38_001147 [Zalerion maritima]